MSIERDILCKVDFTDLIKYFAAKKSIKLLISMPDDEITHSTYMRSKLDYLFLSSMLLF